MVETQARAFRDITATIVEGSNIKMKDLMKQLEIETDEANEVDEKEFRLYWMS